MNIGDLRCEGDPEVIPEDWLWERIINWRTAELYASDWTQLPDAKVDASAWATYRQALRDITGFGSAAEVVFPVRP